MIEAFYGANGMPTGILIDQLGTYLVLSTVGIVLICLYAEGAVPRSEIVKRIVTFPPLIALVVAVALLPVPYPPVVSSVLSRLGDPGPLGAGVATPLARKTAAGM